MSRGLFGRCVGCWWVEGVRGVQYRVKAGTGLVEGWHLAIGVGLESCARVKEWDFILYPVGSH